MLMCPNLSFRLTFLKTVDICATSSFLNGRCNFSHPPEIFAGKKSKRLSAVSADLRRRRNPFNRNLRVCNLLRIICDRLIREIRVWQMHSWVFFFLLCHLRQSSAERLRKSLLNLCPGKSITEWQSRKVLSYDLTAAASKSKSHVVHYLKCWYKLGRDKGGLLIFRFNLNCWRPFHLLPPSPSSYDASTCT